MTKTTNIVRTSRFHTAVEQEVRQALNDFGIPSHLVEMERMDNVDGRATFMLYINGEEVFEEPKLIEFIRNTIVDGFHIAKVCINLAKEMQYDQMNNGAMDDGYIDEGEEAFVEEVAPTPAPAPAPVARRRGNAKKTNAPAPAPVQAPAPVPTQVSTQARPQVVEQVMRFAAARDGTTPLPPRKRFGRDSRNAGRMARPSFIRRTN